MVVEPGRRRDGVRAQDLGGHRGGLRDRLVVAVADEHVGAVDLHRRVAHQRLQVLVLGGEALHAGGPDGRRAARRHMVEALGQGADGPHYRPRITSSGSSTSRTSAP